MAVVARLYRDMRDAERHAVAIDGTLRNARAEPQDVVIEDLSTAGFRTQPATGLAVGDVVTLGLYGAGLRSARVMREDGGRYACQFLVNLADNELAFALSGPTLPEPTRLPVLTNVAQAEASEPTASKPLLSPRYRMVILVSVAIGPWLALGAFWFVMS